MVGGRPFMADQLSSLFQRPYLVKECPQLQTYHVLQAIGDDRNGFTDTVANDSIWHIYNWVTTSAK